MHGNMSGSDVTSQDASFLAPNFKAAHMAEQKRRATRQAKFLQLHAIRTHYIVCVILRTIFH